MKKQARTSSQADQEEKQKSVIVIAGGSRGLGLAVAIASAKLGHSLALISRSKTDLETAKKEIQGIMNGDVTITTHPCDLSNETETRAIFTEIQKVHRKIRVLVNTAAGWVGSDSVFELKQAEVQEGLDVNFFSVFNSTQAALQLTTYKELAIINVGATASLQGWPDVLPFCIGKVALRTYSQALARELGPKGIHVAHLVIDGQLAKPTSPGSRKTPTDDDLMDMVSVANTILHVAFQEKSCWTFEWDVRPFGEDW